MPTIVSKGQVYTEDLTRTSIILDCSDRGDTLYIGHHRTDGLSTFEMHYTSQEDLIELRDALTALIDWNEVEDSDAEEDTDEDQECGLRQGCYRHQD